MPVIVDPGGKRLEETGWNKAGSVGEGQLRRVGCNSYPHLRSLLHPPDVGGSA